MRGENISVIRAILRKMLARDVRVREIKSRTRNAKLDPVRGVNAWKSVRSAMHSHAKR
jgi:hypothetical protein